jgi:hypothetical protein
LLGVTPGVRASIGAVPGAVIAASAAAFASAIVRHQPNKDRTLDAVSFVIPS